MKQDLNTLNLDERGAVSDSEDLLGRSSTFRGHGRNSGTTKARSAGSSRDVRLMDE